MSKTLYVRKFSESLHGKLDSIAKVEGVTAGAILEDAFEKWMKQKKVLPRKHYAVLYPDEESLIKFMKKLEYATEEDEWAHCRLGPDSHFATKYLKKRKWVDSAIPPYSDALKKLEYPGNVFDKIQNDSKYKKACFLGFMTEDFFLHKSLKVSNKVEKLYTKKKAIGVAFCPYPIAKVMSSPLIDILDLIELHDKTLILRDNKVLELNISEENPLKLLL